MIGGTHLIIMRHIVCRMLARVHCIWIQLCGVSTEHIQARFRRSSLYNMPSRQDHMWTNCTDY